MACSCPASGTVGSVPVADLTGAERLAAVTALGFTPTREAAFALLDLAQQGDATTLAQSCGEKTTCDVVHLRSCRNKCQRALLVGDKNHRPMNTSMVIKVIVYAGEHTVISPRPGNHE